MRLNSSDRRCKLHTYFVSAKHSFQSNPVIGFAWETIAGCGDGEEWTINAENVRQRVWVESL